MFEPGAVEDVGGTFVLHVERAGVVRSGRGRVTVLQPNKLRNYIY